MRIKKQESAKLDSLISDCITFNLNAADAHNYIETELGRPYTERSIRRRKAILQSEGQSKLWLSYFTRVGFVQHHRKLLDDVQKVHNDSLNRYFLETQKPNRNEDLILRLKEDIRRNASLLSELGLGTPVISAIKQKLREQQNAEGIQIRQ